MSNEWFETWFDSPYYHLLYQHRDHEEARTFVHGLIRELPLRPGQRVLDLACGKGRHAKVLSEAGFTVLGLDLSANSIEVARKLAGPNLAFLRHDMREPFPEQGFDAVFNFFTSFGYFKTIDENEAVARNVYRALKPGACFVLDFLNTAQIELQLPAEDIIENEGIRFRIRKELKDGFVLKHIEFEHNGQNFHFQERLQAFSVPTLAAILQKAGFGQFKVFGDYELSPYSPSSPRAIVVSTKPANPVHEL